LGSALFIAAAAFSPRVPATRMEGTLSEDKFNRMLRLSWPREKDHLILDPTRKPPAVAIVGS
jgi:hypothetical protein